MADTPISGLPAATLPLSGTESVPIVQGGETRRAPASAFTGGEGSALAPVVTISDTSANLEAENSGAYHRFTASSAKALTIRPESEQALPANGEWTLRNVGSSNLTITPGSGVTINPPRDGTLIMEPGDTAMLKRAAENLFDLIGGTASA